MHPIELSCISKQASFMTKNYPLFQMKAVLSVFQHWSIEIILFSLKSLGVFDQFG